MKDNPIYYSYVGQSPDGYNIVWLDKYPENRTLDKAGVMITFIKPIFRRVFNDSNIIFGEKVINGHRPVSIKANTSKDAPEGDNIIELHFFTPALSHSIQRLSSLNSSTWTYSWQ